MTEDKEMTRLEEVGILGVGILFIGSIVGLVIIAILRFVGVLT